MFGDLHNIDSTELLQFVSIILSKPDPHITPFDRTELDQINAELLRRDNLSVD